jgi:hypothetical protein
MISANELCSALHNHSSELYRKMESLRAKIGQKESREFKKAFTAWNKAHMASMAASDMLIALRQKTGSFA